MGDLRVRYGGTGGPTVLLLHGLGATCRVWDGLIPLLPGEWVAPDLPGHGGSARLPVYSFAGVAQAVADLVDPAGTVVLGHSFGGVVGLHLAASRGVRAVIGLGIKVVWTEEDLARAAAFATREPAHFGTRAEAVARHLKLSGLADLVDPDSPAATSGVVEDGDGWRPALDPRAFAVGDPQMAALVDVAPVPVLLACGEHDAMVGIEQLRALIPDAVDLTGLGHNAHVENPAAVAALVERFR